MTSIVLIEPENPANIGSIARAMANFGEKELMLISPKCRIDEDSRRLAKNAQDILKKAKTKTIGVLKDFDIVIGTTAKLGNDYNIPRTPMMPWQAAERISRVKNKKIALVFGRESRGLSNEELLLCDFIITIPSDKRYPVLNISHALAVILYEIYKAGNMDKQGRIKQIKEKYRALSADDKQHLLKLLDSSLDMLGFEKGRKKQTQLKVWKRMITKSFLSKREAFALMGFFKKIVNNKHLQKIDTKKRKPIRKRKN